LQVGAIAPQSLEHLLPSIHECLSSTDWATRKAAAEALSSLALHSSSLVTDKAAPTLAVLEACRFDKVAFAVKFRNHNLLTSHAIFIFDSSVSSLISILILFKC